MNEYKFVFSLASIMALLVAAPAMGQLTNFPVLSLAPGSAYGTTSISTAFGTGLKNSSDRRVFVARIERGLETDSFGADYGYVSSDNYNSTLALSAAAHLLGDSPVQVSVQSGIGWRRQVALNLNLTTLNVPIGVSIQGTGFGKVRPWVMPRVSFSQLSGDAVSTSFTTTEYGGSAGISFSSDRGVGFSLAYDYLDTTGGSRHELGAVMSYIVGRRPWQ